VRLLEGVATRHPELLHRNPQPSTLFAFLNTRVPPFDHVDARRAVNFAVDRAAVVAVRGGERFARPTCQPLPGGFPGYRRYCPYTAAAAPNRAGPWTAPDLARARALVARSGTRGAHVTVVASEAGFAAEARLLAAALRRLRYRVRLRLLPEPVDYFPYIANSDNRVQVAPGIWAADWPSSLGFLSPVFACASFVPRSGDQTNYSAFCDPETERLMRRAQRLPSGDPRADALWAQADRRITDQAAVVPLVNPQGVFLVSRRLGNYKESQQRGVLYDRVWVR
jgi:peptide/nickel transport system substrate-binding protein